MIEEPTSAEKPSLRRPLSWWIWAIVLPVSIALAALYAAGRWCLQDQATFAAERSSGTETTARTTAQEPSASRTENGRAEDRLRAPELDGGIAWFNTAGPIRLRDLRGKIVLLDFWTFCCI